MKTVSADDSSESEPSRVRAPWQWRGEQETVRVGTAVGNKTLADWELWGAKCCPAQQSGKRAVWHGRSSFWGFVRHCFPFSWVQGWEMLGVGTSPTILLLSWGTHGVWEWLPPGLCLEKHVEPAALEWLPSCPCPRGPHGHDLWGVSTILSLSQQPRGTKSRWWTPSFWVKHLLYFVSFCY